MLPSNAHKRVQRTFRNGVSRAEIETIIMLCLNAHPGQYVCVKDFVILGKFMESAANEKQFAHVAYQLSETGELKRVTRGGNYCYCHWADEPAELTTAR